jgi:hypothetical protein
VFAVRQASRPGFYRLLESEDAMDEQIFQHLPRSDLDSYYQRLIARNLELLATFLEPSSLFYSMHPEHPKNLSRRSEEGPP